MSVARADNFIPRRVALLVTSLEVGGAERVMVAIANRFLLEFRAVDIVLQQGGSLEKELDAGVARHFLAAQNYRSYARQLAQYYDQFRPDFVLTSIYVTGLCALVARFLARHKPKIVIGAHNLLSAKALRPDNIKDKYLLSLAARLLFPRGDAIVCVSHGVANDMLRRVRLPIRKLHVIYNPVVPQNLEALAREPVTHPWLREPRSQPTILSLGRLVPQKGVDTLLRAMQLGPADARLIIVGDGPEREQLMRLSMELGISDRVDFVGVDLNPYKYLARADLFVMSSRWEGFGNTLVEALACGCPVVATNCESGPSEILDAGVFGALVPVDSADRIAAAMRDTLAQGDNHAARKSRIARAQAFDVESAVVRYKELLRTLDPWLQKPVQDTLRDKRCEESNEMVVFVTSKLDMQPKGGRAMLTKVNYQALLALYGKNLKVITLPKTDIGGWRAVRGLLLGYIDGINPKTLHSVLCAARSANASEVFIDGSNLGALASAIRHELSNVRVTTFFHNVEARFFLGSLRMRKTAKALAVLLANYIAERKAVRYSSRRICLSVRDSVLLRRLYGASATDIAPMAIEDRYSPLSKDSDNNTEAFALFVGGAFYANLAGIRWYAENVAPHTNIKVLVVGHGFEALRGALEIPGKLEIVGAVDDLGHWYARAKFVVAPIFEGSGMKTKVAEALMHGKKIVGTPEAFSGYESVISLAGWLCSTKADFIQAMEDAQRTIMRPFDSELRDLYHINYSLEAACKRMSAIMKS